MYSVIGLDQSIYTGNHEGLVEFDLYKHRDEFNVKKSQIYHMFTNFGLSSEATSLVISNLSEVVDNAFNHNFGQWNTEYRFYVASLAQKYKNKIFISVLDLGVGFLHTLKDNYNHLKTEAEAVEEALKPNVSGRLQEERPGSIVIDKNINKALKSALNTIEETQNLKFTYGDYQ